jgi:hypothetical protein
MADINLAKTGLPFLLSGNGMLTVHATVPALDQKLTPSDADLLSADFGAAGDESFTFGAADTIKLGIKAQSKNHLYAVWPTSSKDRLQILDDHGLSDFFTKHPDQMLLVLELDASASANAAGSFQYSVLTASATLDAGGNVSYIYLRPYVQSTTVDKLIRLLRQPAPSRPGQHQPARGRSHRLRIWRLPQIRRRPVSRLRTERIAIL